MKLTAQEQAEADANNFVLEHPEFNPSNKKLDTGETDQREVPMPLRFAGQRVMLSPNWQDGTLWPPHIKPNHEATALIEAAMEKLQPKYADLLRRVYWERQTQEQIGAELGISQQAVSQRVKTAERKLKVVLENDGPNRP